MFIAQIYPIRINEKLAKNNMGEKMFVDPEMPESCHKILHALINKPIYFKVSSSVEFIRLMK